MRRQAIDGELFTNLRAKATDGKAFINVEVNEGETVTVIGEETFATESGTEMLLIRVCENVGFTKPQMCAVEGCACGMWISRCRSVGDLGSVLITWTVHL